jgi:nudix-type nucleoside diphosphatase (YffH/AdpP family)
MALELTIWSRDILVATNGPSELSAAERRDLERHGIAVEETPFARLEGDPDDGGLVRIRLADGRAIERRAMFYSFEGCRQSPLIEALGCDLSDKGAVETWRLRDDERAGSVVAGDASKRVKFAIVAAAEGRHGGVRRQHGAPEGGSAARAGGAEGARRLHDARDRGGRDGPQWVGQDACSNHQIGRWRDVRREIEHHGDAVAVLPFDPDRRVAMLVRQLRAPVLHAAGRASVLEAPAGILDEPEPETCARREAFEEVGLQLRELTRVATAWTMPGISTERMHFFLAAYSSAARIGPGGGLASENEDTEPVEVALGDLAGMIEDGGLEDAKTILLAYALRLRRPDLFKTDAHDSGL